MHFVFFLASLGLFLFGMYVLKRACLGFFGRLLVCVYSFFLLGITGLYIIAHGFTGAGIDDSVIYHVRYGLLGAGFNEYRGFLTFFIVYNILMLLSLVGIYRYMKGADHPRSSYFSALGFVLLIAILPVHPGCVDIFNHYREFSQASRTMLSVDPPADYIIPEIKPVQNPYNVVFIYLESIEKTYFDEAIFPGLLPGLQELAKESLQFSGVQQVRGTGWTIAGIVASQCGIPLMTASGGNSMSGMDLFLPGATCIGDVLNPLGYQLYFFGGASLDFAGKGNFFASHGFDAIHGREELSGMVDPDYLNPWGLFDDSLFEIVMAKLPSIQKQGEPFGLFLLTLDTHHPRGHLSASCHEKTYGDGKNDILNAVHCSDFVVTSFVRSLRSMDLAKNTVIILVSDHLALNNTATDLLQRGTRQNLFMVLHPDSALTGVVERPASMFDVGPTVLSLLGLDVPAFGLGRDLQRPERTFVEHHDSPNQALTRDMPFYISLWGFPTLRTGIRVDPASGLVHLGNRHLQVPVLMSIDEHSEISNIWFEFSSEALPAVISRMPAGKRLIWVDQCARISAIPADEELFAQHGVCLAAGRLGNADWLVASVRDTQYFTQSWLQDAISALTVEDDVYHDQTKHLADYARYSNWQIRPVDYIEKFPSLRGHTIISCGGIGAGTSHIALNRPRTKIPIERGVTLFGLGQGQAPRKLAHVDTCVSEVPNSAGPGFTFAEILALHASLFETFAVISHDSAVCGNEEELANLLKGLPLDEWERLGFREPYIGLISTQGIFFELLGEKEGKLVLEF